MSKLLIPLYAVPRYKETHLVAQVGRVGEPSISLHLLTSSGQTLNSKELDLEEEIIFSGLLFLSLWSSLSHTQTLLHVGLA